MDNRAVGLTERIREEAQQLGFFKVGIVPAGPLPAVEPLDAWLRAGMHGQMGYMYRQAARRKDPTSVMRAVRSLVILAMDYFSDEPLTTEPLRGRISRYAWGEDYHAVVGERVKLFETALLRQRPEARCISYVDTGPVMEKVWGSRSALAWMGKHSNLISRERGSWFFLGVVLLDLELAYDEPEKDYCGTCTRCIPACPTGAIVSPYVVDARLCISYLTIELRGPIPRALRPAIGNRIFGCDDCQEVCPWTRFATRTHEDRLRPRRDCLMPELVPLVEITEEEFRHRFGHSAVSRCRREGFVRNVAVALGNSRSPQAEPALERALRDESPLVRAHAAWALGQVGTRKATMLLRSAGRRERDPSVMAEIELALG